MYGAGLKVNPKRFYGLISRFRDRDCWGYFAKSARRGPENRTASNSVASPGSGLGRAGTGALGLELRLNLASHALALRLASSICSGVSSFVMNPRFISARSV